MIERLVVMGVAGSGKTSLGRALAQRLQWRFVDADELHPAASRALMAAGVPLTDEQRWPWLAAVAAELERGPVVVACSALARRYRDRLRRAGPVGFVHLDIGAEEVRRRLDRRRGHFMGPDMVDSQFAALEPPRADETDVYVVDATRTPATLLGQALDALAGLRPGARPHPLSTRGGPDADLEAADLVAVADELAEAVEPTARRVLLVPPDHTRGRSRAGQLTRLTGDTLRAGGIEVGVLPALGTHEPMGPAQRRSMFGTDEPVLVHDWRDGVERQGAIGADEVSAVSDGRSRHPIPVEVSSHLLDGWDQIISLGQVVPHEVAGMANFTKNLIIGLGGRPTIDATHLLGAQVGIETIMGRADNPVRTLIDTAFDRFLAPRIPVTWALTVVEPDQGRLRGVALGQGGSADTGGSAFAWAAELAAACCVIELDEAQPVVSCWLDPAEIGSTWLGNKAVYRTRLALATGGELIVLAPGVSRFGEDPAIDRLIRRHGYRGTEAVMDALDRDPDLAAHPSAAAHLIHGSSEGRFAVTYCTDPGAGGLSEAEVRSVGFDWRPLNEEMQRLGVGPSTRSGPRRRPDGTGTYHVADPALGLWRCRSGR